MSKQELNAILAGLRFLQGNYYAMPYEIRAIMKDGIPHKDALTVAQIDALCESLNVGAYNPERFEVSRVHEWEDENERTLSEKCSEEGCSNEHLFSVYVRNPDHDGRSEWLSDHISEGLAVAAARAYEPNFDEIIAFQH
jgi:hypothetical protein